MGCGAWCVASCWYAIILASGASYSTQYDGSGWFRPGIVRILGEVEICKHADGHADGSPYRGVAWRWVVGASTLGIASCIPYSHSCKGKDRGWTPEC